MDLYSFVERTYPIRGLIRGLTRRVLRLQRKRVILVFGLSRSGTTMLGEFLALGPSSVYLNEPEEKLLLEKFRREQSEMFDYRAFTLFVFEEGIRAFKVHALMCLLFEAALLSRRGARTISIKPIYLTDVMEEVSQALGHASIVYISRHPCGRSESILRQRQHDQKIDPASTSLEYLQGLGAAWGQGIQAAQALFKRHPGWHWVRFEDLSARPVEEFEALYRRLGLPWTESARAKIQELTTGEDGGFYEIKRNSAAQADKWRSALSEEQVQAIRRGCAPFETELYESF